CVLAAFNMGLFTRFTRSAVLEVLENDYVRTARAKGLPEATVVFRHVLRAASPPILTVVGLAFGNVMTGTVLVENIFAWPGIGQYAYRSVTALDLPAIVGLMLVVAIGYILGNMIVDILYCVIDPAGDAAGAAGLPDRGHAGRACRIPRRLGGRARDERSGFRVRGAHDIAGHGRGGSPRTRFVPRRAGSGARVLARTCAGGQRIGPNDHAVRVRGGRAPPRIAYPSRTRRRCSAECRRSGQRPGRARDR